MNSLIKYKVLLIFLVFLLFPATVLYSQNHINMNHGYVDQKKYLTKIPYKEVKGKIIIEVVVNNKIRKFIFDTGAPVVIFENLHKELNPKTLGKMEVVDQSGLKDSLNIVSLPEIKLNELAFKDIPAFVSKDMYRVFECYNVDGLIGSNLLRNSVVQFDSKNKTITLSDNPKSLNLKQKNSIKMELTAIQSNPYIKIILKKGKTSVSEELLFDTGNSDLYSMAVDTYKQISEQFDLLETIAESEGSFTFGIHGNANHLPNYVVTIPTLEVNKLKFHTITTQTTNDKSLLGTPILNYGKVTLDYKNKRFYTEPFDNISEIDVTEDVWGIGITMENEKIVVGIVWDKALEEKINLGDEILKFGTFDYQNMDFCQKVITERKIEEETTSLVLKDKNTGEIKTIEIKKLN